MTNGNSKIEKGDPVPKKTKLQAAYKDLVTIHQQYLKIHSVTLPLFKTNKGIWLATLHHHKGKMVHKDYISEVVSSVKEGGGKDQQIRHLKRDGWEINKDIDSQERGWHRLNPYKPSAEFLNRAERRKKIKNAKTFTAMKKAYKNACATCGVKEGKPSPRYGKEVVKLQKGHRDPSGSNDMSNIIPQCQFCNQAYKNDYTFDEKGRVRAVASYAPVKRARDDVREDIYKELKKDLYKKEK